MGFGRLVGLIFLAATAAAQPVIGPDEVRAHSAPYIPPPPPNTLRSEVNLVEVPVVVRDGKNRAVPGLKQSDFQVFDNGKKQEITTFSVSMLASTGAPAPAATPEAKSAPEKAAAPEAPRPRFILLCLDNLSTKFGDLRMIKTAAGKFVRTGLMPDDRVAVVTTAAGGEITYTNEVPKLVESIEKVNPQQRFSEENSQCPRLTAYQAYLITNHMDNETLEGVVQEDMACKRISHSQAVGEVTGMAHVMWEQALNNSSNILYSIGGLVDAMKKLPGRRMLLLASSGFLSGNLEYSLEALTAKALHAEVVINSLDAKGLYTVVPGRPIDAPAMPSRSPRTAIAELSIQSRQASAHDDGMAVLALGTGGAFFHNSNDLDKGFHELGATPDVVYILGFSPSDVTPDGRFHPLKVKLGPGKHYTLQSRMGYTAPTKDPPLPVRQPSKLDAALMGGDTMTELPVTFRMQPARTENGTGPAFTVVIHFDVKQMKFEARTDRKALKLAFRMTLVDKGSGALVGGRQGDIELALTQETFDKIGDDGFNITLPLNAAAGNYIFRGVVQEETDGKMSATSLAMEVK